MLAWANLRPPTDSIPAPPFPRQATWVNVSSLRMDRQRGRPVLLEFFDFCRVQSLRTLPQIKDWHRRYAADGLRVVSVHCSGFHPSAKSGAVRSAVARLGIEHPVLIDESFALWREYENAGWPARYLWDERGMLAHYHYGEGAYEETEREIQRLLAIERRVLAVDPPSELVEPSEDRLEAPWSGRYEAGAAWTVLEGAGAIRFNGRPLEIEFTGAHLLIEHAHHTPGVLELELGAGVRCYGVCFAAGAPPESSA